MLAVVKGLTGGRWSGQAVSQVQHKSINTQGQHWLPEAGVPGPKQLTSLDALLMVMQTRGTTGVWKRPRPDSQPVRR